jgi:hypothetical protein
VEQPILLPGQVRPAVEQPIVLPSAGRQPAGVGSAAEGAADSDVDADTDGNGRDPGEPEEAVAEVVLPSAGGQARLASPPHQELAKPPAMRRGSLRPTLQFEWVERISPACPAGLELCGESCVNILFDPLNCGECARSCATPQCFLGRCVKSGP